MVDWLTGIAKAVLPLGFRLQIRKLVRKYRLFKLPVGRVDFGDLRRLKPISNSFGLDRGVEQGQPLDRYYIEKFLAQNSSDVRGRVLEIGDDTYIQKYGDGEVTQTDVLHYVEGNPKATIVADLTACDDTIPSDTFDCIIFTQTLHVIYDARAALRHLYRILKPGGVLLLTTQGLSPIGRREGRDDWGEYWRFTTQSLRWMFEETFTSADVRVEAYGNVLAAIAFLHGLVPQDLDQEELDHFDPDYEIIVAARAVKVKPE